MHNPTEAAELIDMDEAIERLKTTRPTFYRWLRSGRITGMKVGRQWRFYPEDIDRFLKGQGPRVDLPLDIQPLNQQLIEALGEDPQDLKHLEGIEKTTRLMIRLAQTREASHLHLESLYHAQGESVGVLRLRQASGLVPILECDKRYMPALFSQFKSLAGCDPQNTEMPQSGQFPDLTDSEQLRLRAHFLPSLLGESLVLTLLKPEQHIRLEQLKLSESVQKALKSALKTGWGLVITSGPTGSGKTTTLYAALQEVASPKVKTIALESPVEKVFPWVVPVPVFSEDKEGFEAPLKSVMQSDPDVILIGELREPKTVITALQIGLTGHLVLTQMHSESALHALCRLVELTGSAFTVSEAVKVVLNQRLMRKNCPACLADTRLTEADQARFVVLFEKLGKVPETGLVLKASKGCNQCQGTGYRGRLQVTEAVTVPGIVGQSLQRGVAPDSIETELKQTGWQSWLDVGFEKVLAGESTLEELARVAGLL